MFWLGACSDARSSSTLAVPEGLVIVDHGGSSDRVEVFDVATGRIARWLLPGPEWSSVRAMLPVRDQIYVVLLHQDNSLGLTTLVRGQTPDEWIQDAPPAALGLSGNDGVSRLVEVAPGTVAFSQRDQIVFASRAGATVVASTPHIDVFSVRLAHDDEAGLIGLARRGDLYQLLLQSERTSRSKFVKQYAASEQAILIDPRDGSPLLLTSSGARGWDQLVGNALYPG